jgi:hypothetical protein
VVGGTEFISFHVVQALRREGHAVSVWSLREGLDRREIDFSLEDALLRRAG